jgi:hypothetical protein
MRVLPSICFVLACASAGAQTSPSAPASAGAGTIASEAQAALDSRKNQRIERIQHEDAGSRIDELRVGGQTQTITVQPKAGVPEYGIEPPALSRTRPGDHRDGLSNATGQRFWNLFRF